jgi:histone-lysine N-methyltransferase MLL3
LYWSIHRLGKRCQYICSIHDRDGKPEFQIQVKDIGRKDVVLKDSTPKGVWQKVLEPIESLRREAQTIKVFPQSITGEDLFGLTEPSILRVLESLPGVESLTDYNFKYGRSPLLELPLAINPTGCARSEPKLRTHFKRSHTLHTSSSSRSSLHSTFTGMEAACPYTKQFVHSKSSQYRRMKTEWRNNVYLARSRIQGLGLYAARDLEKHTMVIEYIGEVIRSEVSEERERLYTSQNRGIYMFKLDDNKVIDATLSGGLARYINHSCNPNCVTELVQIDREYKIIIFANRRIVRGEELAYDYKFDLEDDQHKIPCCCGASRCRKWMN